MNALCLPVCMIPDTEIDRMPYFAEEQVCDHTHFTFGFDVCHVSIHAMYYVYHMAHCCGKGLFLKMQHVWNFCVSYVLLFVKIDTSQNTYSYGAAVRQLLSKVLQLCKHKPKLWMHTCRLPLFQIIYKIHKRLPIQAEIHVSTAWLCKKNANK